jgi:hypothetical protein
MIFLQKSIFSFVMKQAKFYYQPALSFITPYLFNRNGL